jgi:hypothetical protein
LCASTISLGSVLETVRQESPGDLDDHRSLQKTQGPSAVTFTVTTTADSGPGSLRQAILDANATPDADAITFNIAGSGVKTISPASGLPTISQPVTIDGWTQGGPGYAGPPLIELNGTSAGAANGLVVLAGMSTVRGLVINRF